MKDTHTPPTSIRIPPDVKARAQAKAELEGRTLTDVIVKALERYAARAPR